MNDGVNPYAAPEHPGGPPMQNYGAPGQRHGEVHGDVMMALLQTRRWVMVIGVICVIFAGFMCLAALAMLAVTAAPNMSELPFPPAVLSGFYLAFAAAYVPPALYLMRYASAIRDLEHNRSQETLARALGHQKSFWKYAGIFTLAIVGIYLLVIVGAVFTGFMAAAAR